MTRTGNSSTGNYSFNLTYSEQVDDPTEKISKLIDVTRKVIPFLSPLEQTIIQLTLLGKLEAEIYNKLKLKRITFCYYKKRAYKKLKLLAEMYEYQHIFYCFYKTNKLTGKFNTHSTYKLFKETKHDKNCCPSFVQARPCLPEV